MKVEGQLQQFYEAYRAGEKSPTIAGREEHFNKALKALEAVQIDSGEYYYDIGNSYFQLEQYPWALFYYLKAEQLLPRDGVVKSNIAATLQKLELKANPPKTAIPLSLPEELYITQVIILLTTLLFSCRIWMVHRWLQLLSKAFLALTFLCLMLLFFQHYFTSERAVLSTAAILYKNPGTQYERVFLEPLPPGTLLQIVGEAEQGVWTKVVNSEGNAGFIQTSHLLF